MASDGSTSDTTGLTSAPSVDGEDSAPAMSLASTNTSQLHQGKESQGTLIQADAQKMETETTADSKEGKEPAILPTTAAAPAVLKSPDGTVKSPSTPKKAHVLSPLLRFPLRIGITWKKGEKLEAMDFSKTWYPSKIVEINETEKTVLIHFDGWNSRYDEWVPMASEKLRPQTRHSERKDKKSKNFPQPCAIQDIYRPGEGVLARWTDCKKYPARISRLMPDGTFEVVFYDGVTRNVQPINVQPLPEELKQAADNIQLPASTPLSTSAVKSSFKSVKLELPEGVVKQPTVEVEMETCNVPLMKLPGLEKKNRHMEKSIKKSLAHISGSFKKSPLKAHRLKVLQDSSKKKLKKKGSSSSSSNQTSSSPSSSGTSSPSSSTSSSSLASSSSSSSSLSSTSTLQDTSAAALPGALVVSSSTSGDLKMVLKIGHSLDTTSIPEQPVAVAPPDETHDGSSLAATLPTGAKRVKKRSNTDPTHSPRKKRKKKLKEAGLIPKSHKGPPRRRVYSLDLGASSTSVVGSPNIPETPLSSALSGAPLVGVAPQLPYFVPSKAFIVEEDHNPYKCPFDACIKEFRKENLLTSHIKHYHDNLVVSSASSVVASSPASIIASGTGTGNTMSCSSSPSPSVTHQSVSSVTPSVPGQSSPCVPASPHHIPMLSPVTSQTNLQLQPVVPARRRRRKTDSFCSTDSDMSVSSKGRSSSSKRQRHDSEISVTGSPDILSRDLWAVPSRSCSRRRPRSADVKLKAPQDSQVEDSGETEEEDVETDLVNCICQIRETNGLMIQCDVCMCWQHFTCVDTEGTGRPPANYVCLACERPKGVRDSCKYLYDMGWERRGELPTFPFLGETFGRHTERMKRVATDSIPLSACLMDIKAVLHSTRRQIKISKEEDEPEFQLWQTDWDNWTKPEEDLTLTPPRSVEAAPSPAPSTFMFPPASHSPPLLPQLPGNSLPGGFPRPETSPGLENLPPTSMPPSSDIPVVTSSSASSSSSSSSSSISLLPSSYLDSFKSWLTCAKDSPKKRSTSSSSSASPSVVSSSSTPTTTTTSSFSPRKFQPGITTHSSPLTTTTAVHSNNDINDSSTEYSDILASPAAATTTLQETPRLSSPTPSSPSSSSLQQQQQQGQLSSDTSQSNSFISRRPPSSSITDEQQQQQESARPSSLLPIPRLPSSPPPLPPPRPLSLDNQQQSPPLESSSPHLTPPINSDKQLYQQQALAATLSRTPSSARSCSRISSLSSSLSLSLSMAAADGSSLSSDKGRSDLDLIRGDLFTIGPGGDAPPPPPSSSSSSSSSSRLQQAVSQHRPSSHTESSTRENNESDRHNSNVAAGGGGVVSSSGVPTISTINSTHLSSIPPLLLSSMLPSSSLSTPSLTGSNNDTTTMATNPQPLDTGDINGLRDNPSLEYSHLLHPNAHSNLNERNSSLLNEEGMRRRRKDSLENCSDADDDDDNDDDDVDSGDRSLGGRRRRRRRTSSSLSEHLGQGQNQGHHYHHQPLRELYIDVNSGSVGGDGEMVNSNNNMDDADDDNDTDTAEESVEPYRDCERNLLVHISRTHSKIEDQLGEFEKQIEELEAMVDQNDSSLQVSGENVLNDVPALKKSLGKLDRSLGKIQHLSMYR